MLLRDALKIRVLEQGLKVSDIAEAAGMSEASYYGKCRGKVAFTLPEAIAICDLLDYSLDEFRLLYERGERATANKTTASK